MQQNHRPIKSFIRIKPATPNPHTITHTSKSISFPKSPTETTTFEVDKVFDAKITNKNLFNNLKLSNIINLLNKTNLKNSVHQKFEIKNRSGSDQRKENNITNQFSYLNEKNKHMTNSQNNMTTNERNDILANNNIRINQNARNKTFDSQNNQITNERNVTILTYGHTGSGKTHTMFGTPKNPGITFLTAEEILKTQQFTLSYFQIYNEKIYDLFTNKEVFIYEKNNKNIIANLTEKKITTKDEFISLIEKLNQNKKVNATNLNANSSRAHTVLKLIMQTHHINLVDLAGSEDNRKTGNEGIKIKESANINKSLFVLNSVVDKIISGDSSIPYRDSKITRILKDSLGHGSYCYLIGCVELSNFDESYRTVGFVSRSRKVESRIYDDKGVKNDNYRIEHLFQKRKVNSGSDKNIELNCKNDGKCNSKDNECIKKSKESNSKNNRLYSNGKEYITKNNLYFTNGKDCITKNNVYFTNGKDCITKNNCENSTKATECNLKNNCECSSKATECNLKNKLNNKRIKIDTENNISIKNYFDPLSNTNNEYLNFNTKSTKTFHFNNLKQKNESEEINFKNENYSSAIKIKNETCLQNNNSVKNKFDNSLKYDSVFGNYDSIFEKQENCLQTNNSTIKCDSFSEKYENIVENYENRIGTNNSIKKYDPLLEKYENRIQDNNSTKKYENSLQTNNSSKKYKNSLQTNNSIKKYNNSLQNDNCIKNKLDNTSKSNIESFCKRNVKSKERRILADKTNINYKKNNNSIVYFSNDSISQTTLRKPILNENSSLSSYLTKDVKKPNDNFSTDFKNKKSDLNYLNDSAFKTKMTEPILNNKISNNNKNLNNFITKMTMPKTKNKCLKTKCVDNCNTKNSNKQPTNKNFQKEIKENTKIKEPDFIAILNSGDFLELKSIKNIGDKRAKKILEHLKERKFRKIVELKEVLGVVVYEKIICNIEFDT